MTKQRPPEGPYIPTCSYVQDQRSKRAFHRHPFRGSLNKEKSITMSGSSLIIPKDTACRISSISLRSLIPSILLLPAEKPPFFVSSEPPSRPAKQNVSRW